MAEAPTRIDRFEIRKRVGAGGMGSVYEAYDPELDRTVAIKLLHRPVPEDSAAAQRLLREAQTLAKLNHPNVVQVFGAGIEDGRVWVAMELVAGHTLKQWIDDNPPGTPDRFLRALDLVTQAGQGLAAAHALGVVHRDFKPANVLVGDDGRVRVVDFGLARARASEHAEIADADLMATLKEGGSNLGVVHTVTHEGGIVGTPKYMSPEQLEGAPLDERTDQYSFCIAAWETLSGEYPFALGADGRRQYADDGRPVLVETNTSVLPPGIRRALTRGLAGEPRRRYRSMAQLLTALARRRRWPAALLATGALAVVAGVVFSSEPASPPVESVRTACEASEAAAQADRLWPVERAERLRQAFTASEAPDAAVTLEIVESEISRFREAWEVERIEACGIETRAASPEASAVAARLECLDDRWREADQLLTELEAGTSVVVVRAQSAVGDLDFPSSCRDVVGSDQETANRELHAQLQRIRTKRAAGAVEEAALAAEALEARASQAGADHVAAEAALAAAESWAELHELNAASRNAIGAYGLAAGDRRWELATRAAALAAESLLNGGDVESANRWLRHAGASADRRGDQDPWPLLRARCRLTRLRPRDEATAKFCRQSLDGATTPHDRRVAALDYALLRLDQGQYVETGRRLQQLRAESVDALGQWHPHVGRIERAMGFLAEREGNDTVALDHGQRAKAIFETAYGPDSPHVATTLVNLAAPLSGIGAFDEARAGLQRARRIFGEKSPYEYALATGNLAGVTQEMGDIEAALALHQEAVRLLPGSLGESATLGRWLVLIGSCELKLQRAQDALASLDRAIAILRRVGSDGDVASALSMRSRAYESLGNLEAGVRDLLETEEIRRSTSPESEVHASALSRLGSLQVAAGRLEEAKAPLEHAKTIYTAVARQSSSLGLVRCGLALAKIHTAQGEHAKAQREAQEALDILDNDPALSDTEWAKTEAGPELRGLAKAKR